MEQRSRSKNRLPVNIGREDKALAKTLYQEALQLLDEAQKKLQEAVDRNRKLGMLEGFLEDCEDESEDQENDSNFLRRLEMPDKPLRKTGMAASSSQPPTNSTKIESVSRKSVDFAKSPVGPTINVEEDEDVSHRSAIESRKRPQAAESVQIHVLQEATQDLTISDGSSETRHGYFGRSGKTASKGAINDMGDRGMVELSHGLQVEACYFNKLYPYQREGVNWILDLYMKKQGGILADEEGLGKTIQTIIAISALMRDNVIKNTLILAPPTLLEKWGEEFKKWAPQIQLYQVSSSVNQRKRRNIVNRVQKDGGILIISHGLISNEIKSLIQREDGTGFKWNYAIVEDAHEKYDPYTKSTKALYQLSSRVRLFITSSRLHHDLRRLFNVYRWVSKGRLFGNGRDHPGMKYTEFQVLFESPIMRSREKDASKEDRKNGTAASKRLLKLYENLYLRRTKDQVLTIDHPRDCSDDEPALSPPPLIDLAIWIRLSKEQKEFYKYFLKSSELKALLRSRQSPLIPLLILKKLCDHPRFLLSGAVSMIANDKSLNHEEIENILNDGDVAIDEVSDEDLIMESGKLEFCLNLIHHLKTHGHRTLLFSQSTQMLDMIQRILVNRDYRLLRIDDRIMKRSERQQMVYDFQNDSSYSLCLLTTQVEDLDLNLTAADRVIIYDPSWNPAIDNQAIVRARNKDQDKRVYVYRLLTCGSVEEKIYRRHIINTTQAMEAGAEKEDLTRCFTDKQLKELLILDKPKSPQTYLEFEKMHDHQENVHPRIFEHKDELRQLKNVINVSEHHRLHSTSEPKPQLTSKKQAQVRQDRHLTERRRKAHNSFAISSSGDCERYIENILTPDGEVQVHKIFSNNPVPKRKTQRKPFVFDSSSDEDVHIIE